jgi:hypothetical protein
MNEESNVEKLASILREEVVVTNTVPLMFVEEHPEFKSSVVQFINKKKK